MNSAADPPEELRTLIAAAADQTLTPVQRDRLVELLRGDEEARRQYLESISMESMLRWDYGAALASASPVAVAPPPQATRGLAWLAWVIAALMFLAGAGSLYLASRTATTPDALTSEPVTPRESPRPVSEGGPVAVITAVDQADFIATEQPTRVGAGLRPGWVKLRSGRVRIELMSGAMLILEGPAELGLNAKNRVYLRQGTLTAYLDETGDAALTVSTARSIISSWGRRLGVRVDAAGVGAVHALAGNLVINPVLADGSAGEAMELPEGRSLALGAAANDTRSAEEGPFASADEFTTPGPPESEKSLEFKAFSIEPYSYQDGQHDLRTSHEVLDNGSTLRLVGNAWKRLEVNRRITRDTVIEFEFRSTMLGQIHGFGFDDDDYYRAQTDAVFQLYGYEVLPSIGQQFNNYTGGGWKRYRIRIGRNVKPGEYRYLYFVADDDVTAAAESLFRNVKIYEAEAR